MEVVNYLKKFGLTTRIFVRRSCTGPEAEKRKIGLTGVQKRQWVSISDRKVEHAGIFLDMWSIVGLYPMARWLWLVCNYMKRKSSGIDWEEKVDEKTITVMQKSFAEVKKEDLVTGTWHIPERKIGVVWYDDYNIATDLVLEVGGLIAEVAVWLWGKEWL